MSSGGRPTLEELVARERMWRAETYREARGRHEFARWLLRNRAEQIINARRAEDGDATGVRLEQIDTYAISAWRDTWHPSRTGGNGGWDWAGAAQRFRRRPARTEVAVWFEGILCGLALGRISERREVIRIDLMEGKPGAHPLKGDITGIVLETATLVAQAYGATSVRFCRPLPGAYNIYERLGFTFVAATKNHHPYYERLLT